MPVLNFSSTTPAPTKLPSTTSNGLPVKPSSEPEVIERNNNKSPIKRVIEENEISDSPKKLKSGANGDLSNATVKINHDSSTNGSKTIEKVVPKVKVTKSKSTNPP